MRRILCILILLGGFLPYYGAAQSTKTITLTFSEDDFLIEKNDEGYNIRAKNFFVTYPSNAMVPALPFVLKNIPLDDGMRYMGYSLSVVDTILSSNIVLNNNEIILPETSISYSETSYEEDLSNMSSSYPLEPVRYMGVNIIGGKSYVSFLISPFKYNKNKKELSIYTSINLKIKQETIGGDINLSSDNPIRLNPINGNPTISDFNCKYLIITCDSLKPAFQKLAYWKTMKGVPTKVLTTEDIYLQYQNQGATPQLKIKAAIKDYWRPLNRGVNYVLLGGDINKVPSQLCYIKHIIIDNHPKTYVDVTPTDWFYACLDSGNLNWDSNGNGFVGEIEDNVDLTAEAVVARLPVHTLDDATNIVHRIIDYEKKTSLENWRDNILMGGRVYDAGNYLNGQSDAHRLGEWVYGYGIENYWQGEKTMFYDTGTDIQDSAYYFTEDHLQEQLENGYSFVHIESHGQKHGIQTESMHSPSQKQYYDTLYARALTNAYNTIFTTSSCLTNAFDFNEGECLGEALINNKNSGMLAYIGNAREAWLTNGYTTTTTHGNIYKKLFNSPYHKLGKSFMESKNEIVGLCSEYTSSWRWMLFSLNMLGDPEMPVYTSIPQRQHQNIVFEYLNEDELSILINDSTSILCCMSRDDFGETFYVHDNRGCNLADISDDVSFCIIKPNYLPYLGVYAPTVHLQNESIEWDYHVIAKETLIGKNVTNNREEGAFVIEKGKTTINSPRGVTIYDSFEVKIGAELEILPNNP